jgi:hypothetical protein
MLKEGNWRYLTEATQKCIIDDKVINNGGVAYKDLILKQTEESMFCLAMKLLGWFPCLC